jgi:RNA polymerase sigma factor (sigma-70 family)
VEVGDLARAARAGDAEAFATLTEQHRAVLLATAIALLGYTDEAEDAVQDAILVALRRLADLRDPDAAVSWLKAIVRNVCRMQLRTRRPLPHPDPEALLPPGAEPRPDEVLERADVQDWVRNAVGRLSEPIREVTLLRYFTDFSSYQQIAQLCGIPVDTVGSRLRDGRRSLALALRETAADAYQVAEAEVVARRRQAQQHVTLMRAGDYGRVIDEWYRPDASVVVLGGLVGDRSMLRLMMDSTLGAGVGLRLHDAVGSRGVLVWETDLLNPPSDPDHCPPTMALLLRLRQGRVARLGIGYGTAPHGHHHLTSKRVG